MKLYTLPDENVIDLDSVLGVGTVKTHTEKSNYYFSNKAPIIHEFYTVYIGSWGLRVDNKKLPREIFLTKLKTI